ncbi:cytochrome P450 [Crucibulum laeve]|uniref:Cytochrome P450 n=1 Tax=Crucibulum laeve TaxID=68775 RepID=A0A5C3M0S5_9AGAR|nr:cytochrome P450 [Crucibulum laeve]
MLSWSVLLLCITLIAVVYIWSKPSVLPLPPGPKKIPFLGSLLEMPRTLEWQTFAQWSKDYGSDVIHARVAGVDIIILNSIQAAHDLLDRRSALYSGRPRFVMAAELMGWGWQFSAMIGERWRERRRLFQQRFPSSNNAVHQPRLTEFIRVLQLQLLESPDDFMNIVRHTFGGVILALAYGIKIEPTNDPLVKMAEYAIHTLTIAAVPGAFLVDVLPILKYIPEWFPGASFKRKARVWREVALNFRDMPFAISEQEIEQGTSQPSFTTLCLDDLDPTRDVEYQRQIIKDTAGMFFSAGSDNIVSVVQSFILAMLCNPDIQAKAQLELDELLQHQRLAVYDDEPFLPYLSAVVKEVFRWQNPTPIGIPHRLDQDDTYKGFHLPAGSMIIGNQWAMLHDENDYPEPFKFNPERFLKNGHLDPTVKDPLSVAFGFGRRFCPGSHIAVQAVWLAAASILSTFNIYKAVDNEGNAIEPSLEYHSALIYRPLPFKCNIKPRSTEAVFLVHSAFDQSSG